MIYAEINPGIGRSAFDRVIENAHRLLKFCAIVGDIIGIHIVPDLVLIDLIGDYPAGHETVFSRGIAGSEERSGGFDTPAAFFFRSV